MHGISDDAARILAQSRGLQARAARLGVGVGVGGQNGIADEVLDERQRTSTRGVVGVGDAPRAEGPVHDAVLADDASADALEDGQVVTHGATLRPMVRLPYYFSLDVEESLMGSSKSAMATWVGLRMSQVKTATIAMPPATTSAICSHPLRA